MNSTESKSSIDLEEMLLRAHELCIERMTQCKPHEEEVSKREKENADSYFENYTGTCRSSDQTIFPELEDQTSRTQLVASNPNLSRVFSDELLALVFEIITNIESEPPGDGYIPAFTYTV